MSSKDVTIISIAGKKNAGKTTLIRDIIPGLKKRGFSVGTLKYNVRKGDIDHEGKDTYHYFHSGADSVALTSQNIISLIKRAPNPPELKEIVETHLKDVNIVLVEGYRGNEYPKIRIVDSQEPERAGEDTDDELLLFKRNPETGRFPTKDIDKAIGFIDNIIKNT